MGRLGGSGVQLGRRQRRIRTRCNQAESGSPAGWSQRVAARPLAQRLGSGKGAPRPSARGLPRGTRRRRRGRCKRAGSSGPRLPFLVAPVGAAEQFTRRRGQAGGLQDARGPRVRGSHFAPLLSSPGKEAWTHLQRCPWAGGPPSAPLCLWGGACSHGWGANEGGKKGKRSWAFPPVGLGANRSGQGHLQPGCWGYRPRLSWSPPHTHLPHSTCCPERLISAHHFGVAEGGPQVPLQPLLGGSSQAVILHFSFSSFRGAVRECMMKQK